MFGGCGISHGNFLHSGFLATTACLRQAYLPGTPRASHCRESGTAGSRTGSVGGMIPKQLVVIVREERQRLTPFVKQEAGIGTGFSAGHCRRSSRTHRFHPGLIRGNHLPGTVGLAAGGAIGLFGLAPDRYFLQELAAIAP
jgi:hypothetical protein